MTTEELKRGNEIAKEIQEFEDNISLLEYVLINEYDGNKLKKFFLRLLEKNQIQISAQCISFGGRLKVDRECMELIKTYYENKLNNAKAEFEGIGKGGAE